MSAEIDVEDIIATRYKSTRVKKEVNLQFDIGNLLASDLNNIDTATFKYVKDNWNYSLVYSVPTC